MPVLNRDGTVNKEATSVLFELEALCGHHCVDLLVALEHGQIRDTLAETMPAHLKLAKLAQIIEEDF